jgi:hypothetical protein
MNCGVGPPRSDRVELTTRDMLDSEERPVSQCDHATIGSEMSPRETSEVIVLFDGPAWREEERLAAETLGEAGDARGVASAFKLVARKTRTRSPGLWVAQ